MIIFPGVCGHEHIQQRLSAAIENKSVSHAYLFEGMAGTGKKTMAVEFIKALLCTDPQAHHAACGRCLSCRTIASGNHPDFFRISRGSKNSLGIDEIRDRLVRDIRIQPYQSAYKVYLIEDADTMTTGAQNALLKTLEEPPSYVLIILTAKSSQVFLPTVLSRVITMRFQPLPENVIAAELVRREGIDPARASLLAALSRGSLGEALDLLSSEEFTALRGELTEALSTLHQKKPSDILQLASFFDRWKDQQETVFSLMQIWFRDLIMLKTMNDPEVLFTKDQTEALRSMAFEYTTDEVSQMFAAVSDIQNSIRSGAQYTFAIDCLLMRLIRISSV